MILTLTNTDLFAAKSVNTKKRNATNCIIAQALKRAGAKEVDVIGKTSDIIVDGVRYRRTKRIIEIVDLFDDREFDKLSKQLPTNIRFMK